MHKEIKIFLEKFYQNISFKAGEEPDYTVFKSFFVENAMLTEFECSNSERYKIKTISQHLDEMASIFNAYPEIKKGGFNEKEVEHDISVYGPIAFVKSRYKKVYFNGAKWIEGYGTNCMQIVSLNGKLRVLSLAWYEDTE